MVGDGDGDGGERTRKKRLGLQVRNSDSRVMCELAERLGWLVGRCENRGTMAK